MTGGESKATAVRVSRLRRALLAWYRAVRRDLPWRRTGDPYAIWVAETMLQQTRVDTVIPYYERFLARFPDVRSLATADLEEVLELWAGLGYYARACHLQAAAHQIVECHEGQIPGDVESLRSLPGVGRYTADAVASIAFDRCAPILDGNVTRVLSRLLEVREPIELSRVRSRLWEEAERLARGAQPGDLNQALMELGARVCTPRAPRCEVCPLRRDCPTRASGDAEELPVRTPKRRPKRVRVTAALVVRSGRALVVRRPLGGLLGGLWELPGGEFSERESPADAVERTVRASVGLSLNGVENAGLVEHAFSHRLLRLHIFRGRAEAGRVRLSGFDAHRWVAPRSLLSLPTGTATRKAIKLALES
jgi:A/G-specific adenine glycosylase